MGAMLLTVIRSTWINKTANWSRKPTGPASATSQPERRMVVNVGDTFPPSSATRVSPIGIATPPSTTSSAPPHGRRAGPGFGYPTAFGMGNLTWAYLHIALHEWFGERPGSPTIGTQFRSAVTRGKQVVVSATVTAVRELGDGQTEIDLDLRAEDGGGAARAGTATVVLATSDAESSAGGGIGYVAIDAFDDGLREQLEANLARLDRVELPLDGRRHAAVAIVVVGPEPGRRRAREPGSRQAGRRCC